MDYTKQNIIFKIKKTLRYIRLYGISRTFIKVQGQFHMNRNYNNLPKLNSHKSNSSSNIGIIGCGNFAFSNIAYYLSKNKKKCIRGVMDIDINKSASLAFYYDALYYTDDVNKIINDDKINLVYISSNHASHAEYALLCISKGKSVHIEKPHVVNFDQLYRLNEIMRINSNVNVFLGFNRTRSPLFQKLIHELKKEQGPSMINWFIAGHDIPDDHWYFQEKEGGRVLGNLCHWTDLTLQLVGIDNAFPCKITSTAPLNSKSDFVFSILFSDRSCATITFSAKGHSFEGVKEVLNLHKGNLIGNITDFRTLKIDIIDKKINKKILYRDHGHKENILNSFNSKKGEHSSYIYLTAKFFLAFKQSLISSEPLIVTNDY
jgi:predicted dehydrogenase